MPHADTGLSGLSGLGTAQTGPFLADDAGNPITDDAGNRIRPA